MSEWVEDCWHGDFEGAPTDGSAWTDDKFCEERTYRGGSFVDGPAKIRSAYRESALAHAHDAAYIGLRMVRELD